jgi:hypothetical protein
MRKLLILIFVIGFCVSCSQNYSRTGPAVDLFKAAVEDYQNGDWDAWASKFADTAKIHHNVPEGKGITAAEQIEVFKPMVAALSSYGFDEDAWYEQVVTDEGHTWVNVWAEWHGVIAANNKEIIIPVHITARVEDGLIRREFVYYNPSELEDTLAALEAEANAAVTEESDDDGNEE